MHADALFVLAGEAVTPLPLAGSPGTCPVTSTEPAGARCLDPSVDSSRWRQRIGSERLPR